jgi:hypothetical protein
VPPRPSAAARRTAAARTAPTARRRRRAELRPRSATTGAARAPPPEALAPRRLLLLLRLQPSPAGPPPPSPSPGRSAHRGTPAAAIRIAGPATGRLGFAPTLLCLRPRCSNGERNKGWGLDACASEREKRQRGSGGHYPRSAAPRQRASLEYCRELNPGAAPAATAGAGTGFDDRWVHEWLSGPRVGEAWLRRAEAAGEGVECPGGEASWAARLVGT